MMRVRFLPDYLCDSPLDIPPSFFVEKGIKLVLCDLDNTLAVAQSYHPEEKAKEWVSSLKKEGLKVGLASNGRPNRVKTFASDLDIPCLFLSFKPLSFRLRIFVRELGFQPNETIFIGDQTYTDIRAAKHMGIKAILCALVSEDEYKITAVGRSLDKKARAKIDKENLVPHWKEMK